MLDDDSQVRDWLVRGGMWSPTDGGDPTTRRPIGKYNASLDPEGAEELGRRLANLAREFRPTSVLLWEEDAADLVLAHIVARELGVAWARAMNQDGLITIVGRLDPAARLVVLADAFRDNRAVDAIRGAADRAATDIVAFAVLVETQGLAEPLSGEVPVVSLLGDALLRDE